MCYSDDEIQLALARFAVPDKNVFLVEDSCIKDFGLIVTWAPESGPRMLIIESDDLAAACYRYLAKRGIRRFQSTWELLQAAEQEAWS
jgi:hypothetical protein